jgi:hypothetical protein
MAKILKKVFDPTVDEVVQNFTIQSWHVSQSVDAFTGADAYDVTLSGSLVVTGSVAINGLTNTIQNSVLTYDVNTGLIYYTASSAFAVNNFYTSSVTQNITSSVVNNNFSTSSVIQNITSSTVNNPAPFNQCIQYNSASAFGASVSFQYVYPNESLQQGASTLAGGPYSHAEGKDTRSAGIASHAEGYTTFASGTYAHAEGSTTTASGDFSHAEGYLTKAIGIGSHTEGSTTQATSDYTHAEGFSTIAMANFAHAEGQQTIARGIGSHAEGGNTLAQGMQSHAEGSFTIANAAQSHAEGAYTTSSGIFSHAEGEYTYAAGQASHAEGRLTQATADYSHAEGLGTWAGGDYQHVQGRYNLLSPFQSAFIIGNGTNDGSRSNLVYASGSFFSVTGSVGVSSTLTTSGSRVRRYRTITLTNADYTVSPSKQVQSDDDVLLIIDNTTAACPAGEGSLNITNFLNSPAGRCVEIVKIKDGTGTGIVIINSTMAGTTLYLNDSTQLNGTRTICPSVGNSITLMSLGVTPSGSAWGNGY